MTAPARKLATTKRAKAENDTPELLAADLLIEFFSTARRDVVLPILELVEPKYFPDFSDGRVFDVLRLLHTEGRSVDSANVKRATDAGGPASAAAYDSWLEALGRRRGGSGMPSPSTQAAREAAAILKAGWTAKQVEAELERAAGLSRAGSSGELADLLRGIAARVEADGKPKESPALLHTAGHFVDALEAVHRAPRLATGLKTLDAACNGGFPVPRLVVVGGAPGAGKTTFVSQLGLRYARAGHLVAFLSVDEGPEGVVARLMQGMGYSLDDGAWTDARAAAAELPVWLCDGASVEDFAAEAQDRAEAEGRKLVLVVDSIQTVNARGAADAENAKLRVDAVVAALKQEAKRALVLATCELARGSYRSKNQAEQVNDLAAFKESGSVEYAMQTGLVLRSEPGDGDLVTVTIPKNRGARHTKPPFRLHLHRPTATFHEVAFEPEAEVPVPGDGVDRIKGAILRLLAKDHGVKSKREIERNVEGRSQAVLRAIDELTTKGLVVFHSGVYRLASEVDGE